MFGNLLAIKMNTTRILINKLVYLVLSVSEKIKFWYDYV